MASSPRIFTKTFNSRRQTPELRRNALSLFIVPPRAQASRRCETQATLSGKPPALLAFRSLDPFRALREPDRRRRDEERPSPLRTKNLLQTKNDYLTGKAPYRFESPRPLHKPNARAAGNRGFSYLESLAISEGETFWGGK